MILVIGAMERIGREVVRLLKESGAAFTAVVDDVPRARTVLGIDVALLPLDLDNRDSIFSAFKGKSPITKLFLLTPPHPQQIVREMQLLEAATKSKVKQIVKLSVGAHLLQPVHRVAVPAAHVAWQVEEKLRHGGRGAPIFTILNVNPTMGAFLEPIAQQLHTAEQFTLPLDPHTQFNLVDERDVAETAVACLLQEGHKRKSYTVTGPANQTLPDMAQLISREAKRSVAYRPLPVPLRTIRPPSGHFADEHRRAVQAAWQQRAAEATSEDVAQVLGRPPRSLAAYIGEHRGQFALDVQAVEAQKRRRILGFTAVVALVIWLLWRRKKRNQ